MSPGGTGFEAWRSARFCYVTTTGRRSGDPHQIEIWFAVEGSTLYFLAGSGERSDTVRNLRVNPGVRVRVGRETFEAIARVVEEAAEASVARRAVAHKYAAEEEGLEMWAESALPVALELRA